MGANLSLAQAAKFAGVTQTTMRKWAEEIPDVARGARGEYQIPEEALRGYLATSKKPPRVAGASKTAKAPKSVSTSGGELLGVLRAQILDKDREIADLKADLKDVRAQLREAESGLRQRDAEMKAYLSESGGVSKALSRWFRGK